jgi:polar amino acid transport system substrate-binding protein
MRTLRAAFALIALMMAALPAAAQVRTGETLRIGTRVAPPFAMKAEDGRWEGISIDLLNQLAAADGFEFDLVETNLEGMISDVADGRLDASIAAMTVTLAREKVVDFSNPFYHSGLGAAVAAKPGSSFYAILEALTSPDFLSTIGLLLGLLLVVGFFAWLAERRANPRDFEPEPARGLFSGFWWAAVTMTTVGYGDKVPKSFVGRLLGVFWMFYALILSAIIVAQLSAAVTEHRISHRIADVDQLARMSVGYVRDAASLGDLRAIGVRPTPYADVEAGFQALLDGGIEAFVHDQPILIWMAARTPGIEMTPIRFAPQNYAIVLPDDSPHREELNQAILSILSSRQWAGVLRSYLGTDG